MKKNILINGFLYFLYFIGSCIITMIVENMLVKIVDKFVLLPYPVLSVIRIVVYTAGVVAILAVVGRKEGYREAYCHVSGTILAGGAAAVVHLLFSMLFHFQGFVSGAVRYTAGLVFNGWGMTPESLVNDTPYWGFLVVFAAYAALYVATLTVAKYLGAQKRIIDRAELRKGEDAHAEAYSEQNNP